MEKARGGAAGFLGSADAELNLLLVGLALVGAEGERLGRSAVVVDPPAVGAARAAGVDVLVTAGAGRGADRAEGATEPTAALLLEVEIEVGGAVGANQVTGEGATGRAIRGH